MKTPGMAATPAAAILEASVTALEWWESKNLSIDDFLESDAALQEYRRSIAGTVFLYFRNKLFIDRLLKRRLVQRPRQELLHHPLGQLLHQEGLPHQAVQLLIRQRSSPTSAVTVYSSRQCPGGSPAAGPPA